MSPALEHVEGYSSRKMVCKHGWAQSGTCACRYEGKDVEVANALEDALGNAWARDGNKMSNLCDKPRSMFVQD